MPIDWDKHVLQPTIGVFGEGAAQRPNYRPLVGTPFDIDGVFDRAYISVVINDDGAAANSVHPVLGVRLAQFTTPPAQNDKVFVPSVGITYVVRSVEPDGHGWALLKLNAVRG